MVSVASFLCRDKLQYWFSQSTSIYSKIDDETVYTLGQAYLVIGKLWLFDTWLQNSKMPTLEALKGLTGLYKMTHDMKVATYVLFLQSMNGA